jgi:hypothetical protein
MNSPFATTIERIDNAQGHVIGNVALVLVRFQSFDQSKHINDDESSQWSRSKFLEAKQLRHTNQVIDATQVIPRARIVRTVIEENREHGTVRCSKCLTFLQKDAFNENSKATNGFLSVCKTCMRVAQNAENATLIGCLQTRRNAGIRRAKAEKVPCNIQGRERRDKLLSKKWVAQGGRGFYTRIPLRHVPTKNWVVSIERLTKEGGYTAENTVLEVFESNTPRQWSIEFADAIWGPCPN